MLLLAVVWLLQAVLPALAESFTFQGESIPGSGNLDGWYIFRAYTPESHQDQLAQTTAEIEVAAVATHDKEALKYTSLEATIMDYSEFRMMNAKSLCYKNHFAGPHQIKEKATFKMDVVKDPAKAAIKKHQVILNHTGEDSRYIFFLTNCGLLNNANIKPVGSVKVKNSYGYLPPEQYHMLTPLMVLAIAYVGLAAVWIAYGVSRHQQFYDLHYWLTGLALLCIGELGVKVYALENWNSSSDPEPWMSVATTLFAMKWVCLYCLAIYISTGIYDMDDIGAERQGGFKLWTCTFLGSCTYALFLTVREFVRLERDGLNIVTSQVLGFNAPVMLMDVCVAVLVVLHIQKQHAASEAKLDTNRSQVFSRLFYLSLGCVSFSAAALAVELSDVLEIITLGWKVRWFPREGSSHLISLVAVAGTMIILRPGMVDRSNEYGQVTPNDKGEVPGPETLGRPDDLEEM